MLVKPMPENPARLHRIHAHEDQIATIAADCLYWYQLTAALQLYNHYRGTGYDKPEAHYVCNEISERLLDFLSYIPEDVHLVCIREYTKKNQPHMHYAIGVNQELSPYQIQGVVMGLKRLFDLEKKHCRFDFQMNLNPQAWLDYIMKDVVVNNQQNQFGHKDEYFK